MGDGFCPLKNPRVGCSIHPLSTNLNQGVRDDSAVRFAFQIPLVPVMEFCLRLTHTTAAFSSITAQESPAAFGDSLMSGLSGGDDEIAGTA